MTPEQALNKLDETVIGDLELKIILSKALEKQIDQPPTWLGEITIRTAALGCPNCNEFVGFKQLYCAYCGQKLDWRVFDND